MYSLDEPGIITAGLVPPSPKSPHPNTPSATSSHTTTANAALSRSSSSSSLFQMNATVSDASLFGIFDLSQLQQAAALTYSEARPHHSPSTSAGSSDIDPRITETTANQIKIATKSSSSSSSSSSSNGNSRVNRPILSKESSARRIGAAPGPRARKVSAGADGNTAVGSEGFEGADDTTPTFLAPANGSQSTVTPILPSSSSSSSSQTKTPGVALAPVTNVNHTRQVNEIVPRVWVISNFHIPVTQQIAAEALQKGDILVLGCSPGGVLEPEVLRKAEKLRQRYPDRCMVVELDIRNQALCSSTVAQALHHYGRIDILVNATSRAYVGALEEVEEWHFRNQMDLTFYGAVNMIQAVLPLMRKQFFGHIINIADVNGNIGTPALSLVAAAMHALEGYAEALAFEVAPFNIKVTIVESPMEVNLFTTPMVFAPSLPQYGPETTVGKVRRVLGEANVFPTEAFKHTVHTVISIGGLDNPPGRIIVGKDAIHQIKDKLAMLSDDLEEFQNVSYSADFAKYDLGL